MMEDKIDKKKNKKKTIRLPKPKTTAKLVDQVATLLQRLVRARAADENGMARCVSCNKESHWTKLQGGHFISRTHLATKLVENNINPQCYYCNCMKAKDALMILRYQDWMISTHGLQYVDYLKRQAVQPIKFERSELLLMIDLYEKELAILEMRLSKPSCA